MRPLASGNPSRPDLDAAELLDRNETHRLELVRRRAEKWAGGLTALTGLLGAVLVGRAPQNIRAVATPGRATAGIFLAVALAALLFATYRAYQAAYGDPGRLDQLPRQPLSGLAERLTAARYTAAQAAGTHLRQAATVTPAAVALLTAATGITWFAPTSTAHPTTLCVFVGGKSAVELSATTATVRATTPGVTVGPCQ